MLAGCGGGGGGGGESPPIPITSTPTAAPAPNPNVYAADTAVDWTSARYDPSGSGNNRLQTAVTEANVALLTPAWIFNGTVGSLSSVAILGGIVYRTEEGGNTYAIGEQTGSQIWNYAPVSPEGFNASPRVAAGNVYFASTTGAFYVVSSGSGQYEFNYPPPAEWGPPIGGTELRAHYRGAPVYENGTLYIGASNHVEPINCVQGGQLMAFDPLSPTMRAIATLTPNGTSGVGVWSSPVFDASGDMFVATGNTCNVTNEPYGDSMLRVDPNSLSVIWSAPGPIDADDLDFGATPVVVDDEVIDGGKDGIVYAYNTSSGQLIWKESPFPNGEVLGALATDGRYLVVPYAVSTDAQHGGIAVLDLHGNLVWSLVTGEDPAYNKGILSAPAISQGMLFIGYTQPNCTSQCDGLGAFDLATGKRLWWYSTPSPIFGGIVVVQGGVFANEVGNPTTYRFSPMSKADGLARRSSMTYGTHFGGSAYFHDPWLTRTNFEGDNSGPLRP